MESGLTPTYSKRKGSAARNGKRGGKLMPITHQEPPRDTLETLREAAETMPQAYAHNAKMIRDVLDDLDRHWPHPVYIAGLKDMAASGGLSKAEMIGWSYLAQSGSDRKYEIEVQEDPDGTGNRVDELDKGPFHAV